MNKPSFIIKPLEGLDNISFGTTPHDVIEVLGEPSETEVLEKEEDDDFTTVLHYYSDLGLTLFYDGDTPEMLILTSLECDNRNLSLFGKQVFELSENQLIDLLKSNGFDDINTELEEWGEKRISVEDAMIDFYFEDGKLVTVNWGIMDEGDLESDWD